MSIRDVIADLCDRGGATSDKVSRSYFRFRMMHWLREDAHALGSVTLQARWFRDDDAQIVVDKNK